MIKVFTFSFLLLISSFAYCNDKTSNSDSAIEFSHKVTDISYNLFNRTHKILGDELRAKALLSACGENELSQQFDISNSDIMDIFMVQYTRLGSEKKFRCGEKICTKEEFAMITINKLMQYSYMLGIQEGSMQRIKKDPKFCKSIKQVAK